MEVDPTVIERRVNLDATDETVRFARGALYGLGISFLLWIAAGAIWLV